MCASRGSRRSGPFFPSPPPPGSVLASPILREGVESDRISKTRGAIARHLWHTFVLPGRIGNGGWTKQRGRSVIKRTKVETRTVGRQVWTRGRTVFQPSSGQCDCFPSSSSHNCRTIEPANRGTLQRKVSKAGRCAHNIVFPSTRQADRLRFLASAGP
ncbi:hypothetical protein BDW62DRAFT_32307 [Aspergillus aurantiobrunneus]